MPELVAQDRYRETKKHKAFSSESQIVGFAIIPPPTGAWDAKNLIGTPTLIQPTLPAEDLIWSVESSSNLGDIEVMINLTKEEDPFTQANLLDHEEDQVQELIFRIRTSLFIPYHKSLGNSLLTLFYYAKEEDPDSVGISVSSLRNFYSFLQLHTNLKCPTISLTPDNNIYASWRGDQNRVFSIHFLPNGNARFVIFKPNERHPGRQVRISGTTTTDILMDAVKPTDLRDWIAE